MTARMVLMAVWLTFAGLISAQAQLPVLSNVLVRAGKGVLLGSPTNAEAGMIGYRASDGQYVVWNSTSNAFVPIAVSSGGSGTLTGLQVRAASGSSNTLAYSNNPVTPSLGYLDFVFTNGIGSYLPTTGGSVTGSVVITGGLTVYGTQTIYNAVTINSYTTYNFGVSTTYTYTTIYSTQVVYQTTELTIQTNITYSTVDAYSGWNFIGAYLNATGAPYVWTPHFRDTLTNRLDANGVWSFSNATVVGLTGVGSSNTWVQAGTNVTLSSSNANGGVYYTLSSSATAVTQTGTVFQAGTNTSVLSSNANGNVYVTYSVDRTGVLATNAIVAGGDNAQLQFSNANGRVYLSVPSNTAASVTNAMQRLITSGSTSTPTTLEILVGNSSVVTTRTAGTTSSVYLASGPDTVARPLNWGGFRSLTTNSSVLPVFGYVGADTLTATSVLSMLHFVVSATNVAQEKFAITEIEWPMDGATGILISAYFQVAANGMSLAFYNGISNPAVFNIPGASSTFTTNLALSGTHLTSARRGDLIGVACFATNISTNAASTVSSGIGRSLKVQR